MLVYSVHVTDGDVYENLYEHGRVVRDRRIDRDPYRLDGRYRCFVGEDLSRGRSALRYAPEVFDDHENCVQEAVSVRR